jgi:hypothetical protein
MGIGRAEVVSFFFFFLDWRYNPLWVLAFSVIFFQSALSLHNFLHPLIPSLGNKNFEHVINVHKVRRLKLRAKEVETWIQVHKSQF